MFQYRYCVTPSKTTISKLILAKLLSPSIIKYDKQVINKNVFLDSPFHYKTVKTHLHIPSIHFYISSSKPARGLIGVRVLSRLTHISSIKV